jgi:leucyl aminopeptidase
VALGPDLPPFYDRRRDARPPIAEAGGRGSSRSGLAHAALGRLRRQTFDSKIADTNNVTTDGFAGSITAALFLQRFVERGYSLGAFRHLLFHETLQADFS